MFYHVTRGWFLHPTMSSPTRRKPNFSVAGAWGWMSFSCSQSHMPHPPQCMCRMHVRSCNTHQKGPVCLNGCPASTIFLKTQCSLTKTVCQERCGVTRGVVIVHGASWAQEGGGGGSLSVAKAHPHGESGGEALGHFLPVTLGTTSAAHNVSNIADLAIGLQDSADTIQTQINDGTLAFGVLPNLGDGGGMEGGQQSGGFLPQGTEIEVQLSQALRPFFQRGQGFCFVFT